MLRMHIFALVLIALVNRYLVSGLDLSSSIPRLRCFPDVQPNCNEQFIELYPKLSKSASGQQNATTWFLLYTRRNKEKPELLHRCGGKLPPNSNFNPKKRLIILIISFNEAYCDIAAYREWVEQLLQREDANILMIDFGWGTHLDYGLAVQNVKIVAKQSVIVMKNIQRQTGISSKQVYLVGHSLGAQCAGLLGYLWFRETGTKFYRITGLDPAKPSYPESLSHSERLDRSDAEIVDVWHVNAGECLPFLGINYDAGDVDFYVNGGSSQPACVKYGFISLLKADYIFGFAMLLLYTECSHEMGKEYFKVSINPVGCQFVGVECESYEDFKSGACRSCGSDGSKCAIMGYDFDKYYNQTEDHHRYYLSTSLDCPYCDNSMIDLDGFSATYDSSLQTTRSSDKA